MNKKILKAYLGTTFTNGKNKYMMKFKDFKMIKILRPLTLIAIV
ncbi:MAG: hypothetical protein AB2693_21465 [Candidatus Thiodiazotropha sp.]